MRYTQLLHVCTLLAALAFFTACGSKQEEQTEGQDGAMTGAAEGTLSGEIITAGTGYIISNAGIAEEGEDAAYSIKGAMRLKEAPTQVLVVRTQSADGAATEMLALEFPSFADGTALEYPGEAGRAAFWLFGINGAKEEIMQRTGDVKGSLRLLKTDAAQSALGLSRDVTDGIGEMEIVVTGIDARGLGVPSEKKYAARYRLPLITLDEFARINQPI